MMPGKYPVKIARGGTWSITCTQETLNFTDYDEIRMQIRPSFIKTVPVKNPLLELTLANGRITTEDGGATLRLTISAADTESLSFYEGVYDLELVIHANAESDPVIPEEIVHKMLYGSVTVTGEQTV